MKTLILFSDLFCTGGIQMYNMHLCDAIESAFGSAEFAGVSLNDPRPDKASPWKNISLEYCGGNHRLIKKPLFAFKVLKAYLSQRPRFLICAHVGLSPAALFLKRLFGLRYMVMTHGIEVWGLKKGIKYTALKESDIITTISRYTKERMVSNGISADRIRFLPDTVDTGSFYPKGKDPVLSDRLGLGNKRVLLTVGRISREERYKGHYVIMDALKKLGDQYVWLVAGEGNDLDNLRRKAAALGISEQIRFLGHVGSESLIDYYNLCDIFVMPSSGEGFGIVFLEAMACGKPVICGNKDGSSEPAMDGRLGFMVDPESVDEIIRAINAVFAGGPGKTDPAYLRQEVEKNFGIKEFNRKARQILEKEII